MHTEDFTKYRDYIKLPKPIKISTFEAVGWFPYEIAQLANTCVRVPRAVFTHISTELNRNGVHDNKFVVIFRDIERWDTENFAIQFKDGYCKMGKLKEVEGFALKELKIKK